MALSATAENASGRIALSATGLAVDTASVYRVDAFGHMAPVRNGNPATVYFGDWDGYDYEAPSDEPVSYRITDVSTGATLATSGVVTLSSSGAFWLIHPGKPHLSITPTVAEIQPGTRRGRSQIFDVLGSALPVSQSLRRASYSGTLVLRTTTWDELEEVNAILADGHVLMMRAPSTWPGYGTRYIQIADAEFEQLIRVPDGRFVIRLPWTEVARPEGLADEGGASTYTWADVAEEWGSWLEVVGSHDDWTDLADGWTMAGAGALSAAVGTSSGGVAFFVPPGEGSITAATNITSSGQASRSGSVSATTGLSASAVAGMGGSGSVSAATGVSSAGAQDAPAQPAYRASSTAAPVTGTSINVTIPGSVQTGDLLLACIATGSSYTHNTPAGWTLVRTDTGAGTNGIRHSVFWRIADGASAGSTLTLTTPSALKIASVLAYSGASGIDIHGGSGSGANGTTATAPSVTTTVADCTAVEVYATIPISGSGASITPPATSRLAYGADPFALGAADQARPTAGATGTQAATIPSGSWVAQTIAISP